MGADPSMKNRVKTAQTRYLLVMQDTKQDEAYKLRT